MTLLLLQTIMKPFAFILLFIFPAFAAPAQRAEIIDMALKDTSNFRVMKVLLRKLPSEMILLETTSKWNTDAFYLDSIDLDNPLVKAQMDSGTYAKYNKRFLNTYADPYREVYLFREGELASRVSSAERKKLKERAQGQPISKIKLSGRHYHTIPDYHQVDAGYFMTMAEPVFSTDGQFAFISFDVYFKDADTDAMVDTEFKDAAEDIRMAQYYFGDVVIAYEKQQDNSWKKVACKWGFIL